ncbi:afadin- and alpha-actinin-binding protein-like isoform X1 [Vespa mandarinia]|uniref:afadin- and alpha-actinin-binding protein-like isoform X1 n=1 Tax=Vespa mandarinia TaxID=7446 RepID=UPI00160B053F|nr:afadin- and alpha-actinin-binding protein-like isoform X1 [Vespa mandarinia]
MSTEFQNLSSVRNFKAALAMKRHLGNQEKSFCTTNNLEESLSILAEELESFNISPVNVDNSGIESIESLKEISMTLINSLWKLIHKHRMLMKSHDELNDTYAKISNDNNNLKNHVKRLKEELQKGHTMLAQIREKERRLKVQNDAILRDLKQEKNEVTKLKKQSLSKDSQHEHELRRIIQSGNKLREQLQKSTGTYVPKDKVIQKVQTDHEKEVMLYKQTICRLEENNRLMLQEINDLKDSLSLHSTAIDLQMEASGVWTDTDA